MSLSYSRIDDGFIGSAIESGSTVMVFRRRSSMPDNRDELRDELLAILAAQRELPPDADAHLVDQLLTKLERHENEMASRISPFREHVNALVSAIPLSMRQLAAVAFIEAVAVAFFGYIVIGLFGIDTNNDHWIPRAMPLWDALAFLWLLQMILTIAVLTFFKPGRPDRLPDAPRRQQASPTRTT
jgi:hypothetical protein